MVSGKCQIVSGRCQKVSNYVEKVSYVVGNVSGCFGKVLNAVRKVSDGVKKGGRWCQKRWQMLSEKCMLWFEVKRLALCCLLQMSGEGKQQTDTHIDRHCD